MNPLGGGVGASAVSFLGRAVRAPWIEDGMPPVLEQFSPWQRFAWKASAALAAPLALYLLGAMAWDRHAERLTQSHDYQITARRIAVTPQPPWIHGDVKYEAIRDGGLEKLTALDHDAAQRVEKAFALHTWVARVKQVRKKYPALVEVDLEYRRPAAMVEVVGGLYPVDGAGVLLPPDNFAEVQVRDYLRVNVGRSMPAGPVGTDWGDELVADAARIASFWNDRWKAIGLYRVRAIDADKARTMKQPACFALETRQGDRVLWGRAPGRELKAEPSAEDKAAHLVQYVQQHGSLVSASEHLLDLTAPAPGVKLHKAGHKR